MIWTETCIIIHDEIFQISLHALWSAIRCWRYVIPTTQSIAVTFTIGNVLWEFTTLKSLGCKWNFLCKIVLLIGMNLVYMLLNIQFFRKRFVKFWREHSFRLPSIRFDIVMTSKKFIFELWCCASRLQKRSPKNPRSVKSVIFSVALMPDLTVAILVQLLHSFEIQFEQAEK